MQAFAAPLLLGVRSGVTSSTVRHCYRRTFPHSSVARIRRYRGDVNDRDDRRRSNTSYDDRKQYKDDWDLDRQPRNNRRSLIQSDNEQWKGREHDRRGGRRDARFRNDDRRERNYGERNDYRTDNDNWRERDRRRRDVRNRSDSDDWRDNERRFDRRREGRNTQSFDARREKRFEGRVEEGREREYDRRQELTRYGDNRRPRDDDRLRERTEEPSEVQKALASGDDLVYGLQSVKQALIAIRRSFHTLYLQSRPGGSGGERKADNERMRREIERIAHTSSLRVVLLDRGELNALSGNRPHQGVVLRCGALEYGADTNTLDSPETGDVLLALDEVQDPQNVGALLRSAAFLGARGVVVCARNSAPLTPVVSRASAGAAESVEIAATDSMPRFLRRGRQMGWRVLGAASGKEAIDIGEVETGPPTILVLGSEGDGLRTMVKQCCDNCVEISRSKDAPTALDSLNVSVAGALALFKLLR